MQFRGMRGIVDFAQLVDRHVRVDLGRAQIRMPQERLDEARVGAVLQHVRRARVPTMLSET